VRVLLEEALKEELQAVPPEVRETQNLGLKIGGLYHYELKMIIMVSEGKDYEEIARIMHVSVNTVKSRMSRCFGVTGTKNGPSLIAHCFRKGLLK
jgi:DNA-binding CsgD family transcriptional regulator